MHVGEDSYKGICPELLARALSGPNIEKLNVNTLSISPSFFFCSLVSLSSSSESDQSDLGGIWVFFWVLLSSWCAYHTIFWGLLGLIRQGYLRLISHCWNCAWLCKCNGCFCLLSRYYYWCSWLGKCGSLGCSFYFLGLGRSIMLEKSGMVSHIYFSQFWQFLYITPGKHATYLVWGGFRYFCEWWEVWLGRLRSIGEGIGNGLAFFDVVLHFLL